MHRGYTKGWNYQYLTLSQKDFVEYYDRIISIVDKYIEASNKQEKNGWQVEAKEFKTKLAFLPDQGRSLHHLKSLTEIFLESLRSYANWTGSFFFSDSVMTYLGSGSTLKSDIEAILSEIDPLKAEYIIDAIETYRKLKVQNTFKLSQGYLVEYSLGDDIKNLTDYAKCALTEIIGDDILRQNFIKSFEGSSFYKDDGTVYSGEAFLEAFVQSQEKKVRFKI